MLKDDDVEALVALKLTILQAKVYLTLATLKEAKISVISKNVRVARQDLYRVLADLEKKGVVERVVKMPTIYKAFPITEGIPILLERFHEERIETHKKAIQLLGRYQLKNSEKKHEVDEVQLSLISEKKPLSYKLKKEILATERSIDIVTSSKKFEHALFDLAPSLTAVFDRGATIRWITNTTRTQNALQTLAKISLENSFFQLRYIQHDPDQAFAIFDKKRLLIATNASLGYVQSSALLATAPTLVKLAQYYFDSLWKKTLNPNSRLRRSARFEEFHS